MKLIEFFRRNRSDRLSEKQIEGRFNKLLDTAKRSWADAKALTLEQLFDNGTEEVVSEKKNMQLSSVWACMNVLSNSVATLPLGVYKVADDGTSKRLKNHQLDFLISTRPNELFSRFQWMYQTVHDIFRKGYSLSVIHRNSRNIVTKIEYIPSDEISVLTNQWKSEIRFKISRYGSRTFRPEEVLYFMNYSQNGIESYSTLDFAEKSTYLARASEKTASDFYSSGASITGFLSTDKNLGEDRAKRIKDKWKESYGKRSDSDATIPVLEGGMEFHPITVKPNDAQLLETREYNTEEICRFFNVPPFKIFASDNKYNSHEAEQQAYLQQSITPILDKITQEMNYKLISTKERGTIEIQFDETAMLRGDLKTQGEFYLKMISCGVFSPNMVKGKFNEPAVEDGDQHFVASNWIPMDLAREVYEKSADNTVLGVGGNSGGQESSKDGSKGKDSGGKGGESTSKGKESGGSSKKEGGKTKS